MPYRDADDARRVHLRLVEELTVQTPCREPWKRMHGDERVRHCTRCGKDVHDLSAMSLEEIAALSERRQEEACARFYRRPDGRLVTETCPSVDRSQRAARVAGATVGVIGAAIAAALIGSMPRSSPDYEPGSLDELLAVRALELTDFELDEAVAVVASVEPVDPRREAIDALTASGALLDDLRAVHDLRGTPSCSRFTPAGWFDDTEIQDRAPEPIVYRTYGFHNMPSGYAVRPPCPIGLVYRPRPPRDEIESAID